MSLRCLNRQVFYDVQILYHLAELLKGDHSVEIFVSLDDGSVDELLELSIVEIWPNHHLQHSKQFSVWDKAVVVHVVDLESETKFLFVTCTSRQRRQTLNKLQEGDLPVSVLIENSDDSFDQWVLRQFRDVEEFFRFEGAALILVNLTEVLIQLLQFFFSD